MSITREIYLNSKYADIYINNSISNCVFYFQDIITKPNKNYEMYLQLLHFTLPITMYNVDLYHNKLDYRVNNIDYSLTIPSSNYSIDTLISYLNTNITNLTFSANANNYKITITSSFSFTLKSTSTFLNIIGFNENTTYNSVSNSLTSPNSYDLSGANSILIFTNFISSNLDARTKRNSNFLKTIPVDVSNGNILVYKNNSNHKVKIYDDSINYIAIQLQDENRNIIELNGSHFDMTILVELVPIDTTDFSENQLSLFREQKLINDTYQNLNSNNSL